MSKQTVTLKDIVKKLQGGGTPSVSRSEYYKGTVPFVKIDDLTSTSKYLTVAKKHISDEALAKSSTWLVPEFSILYSIYATIGEVAINQTAVSTNQAILGIIPDTSRVDTEYLYYALLSYKNIVNREAKQGTQKNLTKAIVENFEIVLPPIDEQRNIAAILSESDKVINLTQNIIDSSESLKLALMVELLRSEHKLNSERVLPEDWEIVRLDTVAKRGSGHTPNKKNDSYYNGGIKWVSLADTNKLDNGIINRTSLEISQAGINNSSAVAHSPGSVILSRDAGVGKSAVLGETMAVSQHFMVWECSERLHNWYLYYFLQSKKKEFERIAVGSTIKTIGLQYFKDMEIVLPPIDEQVKIANILSAVDAKIKANKAVRSRHEKLKVGLMQELLTRGMPV
jgi:type I restriction enzyme S subunit